MRDLILRFRRPLIVVVHLLLWTLALVLAVGLRFEFAIPASYGDLLPKLLVISLVIRSIVYWRAGLFHGLWRYSGSSDLRSLIVATTISSTAYASTWAFLQPDTFPRSIFVLDWAFSILLLGGSRFGARTLREIMSSEPIDDRPRRKVLVIGAGDAGEILIREIIRSYARRYEPVGFLDDDARKHGERIHGVPVLGPIGSVASVTASHEVNEIIIAIPSLAGVEMRKLLELCRPTGAHIRTLPGLDNLIDGTVTVNQLTEVNIDDLLRREPVVLDPAELGKFLQDRVVMVTGAGGSIGSELCRQILRYRPRRLLLVEQAENSLFQIHRQIQTSGQPVTVIPLIADICDSRRVEEIFARERPNVVFHAAAHKHVPLMEENPFEAIKNNVFGTQKLADTAIRHGVEKFVMVSTDKAVNPTSVMGVSKRIAEMYVQSRPSGVTHFVTVRFGNVLGSAGSVVPLFREQIAAGGPVMVTHPEMKRYFMTIPEACQLVMQAGAMGRGKEIFVLDMGEPVKIVDLARDLIRLSGLEPERDIEIKFSGIRAGEKLFEELAVDEENVDKTKHPKIFVGRVRPQTVETVERMLAELRKVTDAGDTASLRAKFREIVPEYQPDASTSAPPPTAAVVKETPRDDGERISRPNVALAT